MIRRLLLALALLQLAGPAAADQKRSVIPVPPDYFGLHCNDCSSPTLYGGPTTPYPALNQKVVRLWDSGVTWRLVEPSRKAWNWSRLDQEVAQNEVAGVDMMLTLGMTPDYCATATSSDPQYNAAPPTDNDDGDKCWTEYVSAVATRFGARIKFYGVMNEPDQGSWNGSTAQLVRLASLAYPIIHKFAPGSLVMSPELSAMSPQTQLKPVNLSGYIAAGGGAYMDALAIHLYPGDGVRPEMAIAQVESLRAALDQAGLASMPIYDTEDGTRGWRDGADVLHNAVGFDTAGHKDWLPSAVTVGGQSVNLEAAYVTRQYLVTLGSGLLRGSYYYTADNPDGTDGTASVMAIGMMAYPSAPGILLPPALAYRYLAGLLPGGWVTRYRRAGNHWEMDFSTAAGRLGRVYWCDDYSTETVTDAAATSATDNLGNPLTISNGQVVVTASPTFVFYG